MLDGGVSTAPLYLKLCPPRKEDSMDVEESEEPMEVDLDDHDRYLIHLLNTNFESDSE